MDPSAPMDQQQQLGGGAYLPQGQQQVAYYATMPAYQQNPQQQQQQQYLAVQPQYVLPGKPLVTTAGATAQHQLPQLVALPGGTYIQPAHQPQGAGYPQLVGLPPGYTLAPIDPTTGAPITGTAGIQFPGGPLAVAVKQEASSNPEDRPSSSHSANTSAGGLGSDGSPHVQGSGGTPGSAGANKSRYRGVSYDRKKAKWRVQIKVAALGKSGVSVGYFDTEEAAARAYDRAAIGLLGRDNPNLQTNFDLRDYAEEVIPRLTGKSREEVKTTLKSERIKQAPRRRFTSRQRTSRFMGVGSSNRKNQWQARILVHGKVTHLGYYETEEEAARVYDRVSLALHGDQAQTNFPSNEYTDQEVAPYRDLDRENLQRALGVKPMDKSSRFRGVSKKKGKWEAKVMVNRRWAYRELFDSEEEAARAYDRALWRLKPREAKSYVNFKDEIPADAEALAEAAPDYRAVNSDGDVADSDGGYGGGEYSDDGDFEYEYRPTKGTTRSASMRAKKAGSMPNLAAAAAAGGSGRQPRQTKKKQQQEAVAVAVGAAAAAAAAAASGPAFVPLPGGGLQLRFDPISGGLLPQGDSSAAGAGAAAAAAASIEEPLLIRVGSETHVLPNSTPRANPQSLGKRTGLQRIQSEPQFPSLATHNAGDLLDSNAGDIQDLMNDKDLFRGLDLADIGGGGGGNGGGQAHGGGLDLQSLGLDFMNTDGGGSFFEDEELALANLEFSRPKKIPKSMSMSQLSALGGAEEEHTLPQFFPTLGSGGADGSFTRGVSDAKGRPPLPGKPSGSGSQSNSGGSPPLGALGQPIRRTNTFTASLETFEEGHEEHKLGPIDLGGHEDQLGGVDDLVKQFLEPTPGNSALDDAMGLLGN